MRHVIRTVLALLTLVGGLHFAHAVEMRHVVQAGGGCVADPPPDAAP